MDLGTSIQELSRGVTQVIIDIGVYKKDSIFMEEHLDTNISIEESLSAYLNLEAFCFFMIRKNLFYRTDAEKEDILSEAFLQAFLRQRAYPLKSYKGYSISEGVVYDVKLSVYLKKSLESKIFSIAKMKHETSANEILECSLSTEDSEGNLEDFIALDVDSGMECVPEVESQLDVFEEELNSFVNSLYNPLRVACALKNFFIKPRDIERALKSELNIPIEEATNQDYILFNIIISSTQNLLTRNPELNPSMSRLMRQAKIT